MPGQNFLNRRLDEEYGGLAHCYMILNFFMFIFMNCLLINIAILHM